MFIPFCTSVTGRWGYRTLLISGFAAPAVRSTEAFNLEEFWYVIKILHLDLIVCEAGYYSCFGFSEWRWLVFCTRRWAGKDLNEWKTMFVTAFLMIWCVVSLSSVNTRFKVIWVKSQGLFDAIRQVMPVHKAN